MTQNFDNNYNRFEKAAAKRRAAAMDKVEIDITVEQHGEYKFYAMVTGMHSRVKGCPLGRGLDEKDAIADLIYRVSIESHIALEPRTIDRTDRR